MKILVIGGGGREHALAWKAAQSSKVTEVFVAPGNAGTENEPKLKNVPINADDVTALIEFAQQQIIDLTIVGPEAPLVKGVVDRFQAANLRCFGPSQAASQLEGSKAFSKDFLYRHNIPTARYKTFTNAAEAKAYIQEMGAPIVIKADGLAAGKGVILAQSVDEAMTTVDMMLSGVAFGKAGDRVVVEEFLQGEEASFIVMVDGEHILPMATSQDHKARDDGDKGPNTGGMGAYSPAPVVTPELHQRIMQEVIEPTVRGMAADGIPYRGFLYAGIMIAPDGTPNVLEFNCRFGDPETQPIMMRLESDLVELCDAALDGQLDRIEAKWDPKTALGVVMAAGGYPDIYGKGAEIRGLDKAAQSGFGKVFHAGTKTQEGTIVTNGGRVLCACALGDDVAQAQKNAYQLVNTIDWDEVYYRNDIGYRAMQK